MKMKFRRGDKVEVLVKKKVPSGVWRSAEIVADNGSHCTVRYNLHRISPCNHVSEVPREAIRPRPPADCEVNLIAGDIVEVFDDGYWKVARVLGVLEGDYYFVRVDNSFDEFKVPKTSIRVRKNWQDGRWIITGEEHVDCKDKLFKTCTPTNKQQKDIDSLVSEHTADIQKSCLTGRKLKRMAPVIPDAEDGLNAWKRRAIERRAISFKMPPADSSSCIGKVDNAAFPKEKHEENLSKIVIRKTTTFRFSKEDDSDSIASSVGSCSVNTFPEKNNRSLNSSLSGHGQNCDALSSDAESLEHFGGAEASSGPSPRHRSRYVSGDHMLELGSYRSTLEYLHKLGPLNWEQEAYLTDLRIYLNITDDEHLNEVRRLLSLA